MGLFKKNKKKENETHETVNKDDALRNELSDAYDELTSGGAKNESADGGEVKEQPAAGDFNTEILKTRIKIFKDKKNQESLIELLKLLPNREFLLPAVANMPEPFEKVGDKMKMKEGAALNPALLTSKDNKVFLPVFTDETSMTRKSPSGIMLKFKFEQCVGIVYDKSNPVCAIVLNPFTENMIIGEELLRMIFKPAEKK